MASHRGDRLLGVALVLLLALISVAPATRQLLARLDLLIYDLMLPVQNGSMSKKILVVAIDNRSIESLGRWPWDRSVHARLIDVLTRKQAKVIGMDVIFSEGQRNSPKSDDLLIAAVKKAPVILPVAPSRQAGTGLITELLPIPELAVSAKGLGHVDIELDEDGLCRRVFLFGGLGDARWPSLPLAMIQLGDEHLALESREKTPEGSGRGWLRKTERLIPFTDTHESPYLVSVSDVLEGLVTEDEIAGKYVLIGATATGLGDALATPGAKPHERMSGVLLNAQVLNGLLQDRMLSYLGPRLVVATGLVLVISLGMLILLMPSHLGPIAMFTGAIIVIVTSSLLLLWRGVWFPPATTLLAVVSVWPIWAVLKFQRAEQLQNQLLKQLENHANFHGATGLPNAGMLKQRLSALHASGGSSNVACLMIMHVNWPGSPSVVQGRPFSDPILQAIRDHMKAAARPGDFLAHVSGDDFAVLCENLSQREEAEELATQFLAAMQKPLLNTTENLFLAPEIGVSLWPSGSTEPEELISDAYTAMYKSRIDNSDNICVYSASVGSVLEKRSQLEQALIHALDRGEFTVHYQPQVSGSTDRVIGVEALLRWENPLLGWVSPSAFVPVAEQVGLIKDIGAWVIEETCRQLRHWNTAGFVDLRLAINVSPTQFLAPGLQRQVLDVIQRTGVDPTCLELEITESSLMHDFEKAVQVMKQIKESGVELAMDDFGTGYSSLTNLRRFPLDRLKIDQAFTTEIGFSDHAQNITLTIISMARHLGLRTIAEGVETEAQASFLRAHGVDELQGYLFGRPMPPAELLEYLETPRPMG